MKLFENSTLMEKKANSDFFFQMRQYTITEQYKNILQASEQVRFNKQHTSPENNLNVTRNNELLKMVNFENNYKTIQNLVIILLA